MSPQKITQSFGNAFQGIVHAVKTQRNMHIHLIAAAMVILAGFFFRIRPMEWTVIVIAIALVLAFEMLNTALEALVDLVTTEYHPLAKIAKDVAAGAVLICAFIAVILGIIIFSPYLMGTLL